MEREAAARIGKYAEEERGLNNCGISFNGAPCHSREADTDFQGKGCIVT
jgi:hypothetical protein